MVEQFNLKGGKHADGSKSEAVLRKVEITAPIMDYKPGMPPPTAPKSPELEKTSEQGSWKNNPIFSSSEGNTVEDDEEVLKRLSQNGVPSGTQLSDTMSSDMIVNSISNGQ